MGIIRSMVSIVCTRHSVSEEDLDHHLKKNGRDIYQPQEIEFGTNGLPTPDPRVWGSLMHFFSRPWFSRVWVIQEVYFAPKVLFFCTKLVGTFSALFFTADWLLANVQKIKWATDPVSLSHYQSALFSNLLSMKNDDKSLQEQWLQDLLRSCKEFEATDLRDKVFALMNLPSFQREFPDLIPNYHKPTEEVFTDVTIAMMRYRKSLFVLTEVDHMPNDSERNFPSWVPRWHRKDSQPNVSSSWYHYFWAGLSPGTLEFQTKILSGTVLLLSGFRFDVIQDICVLKRWGGQQNPLLDKPTFLPVQAWDPYDPSTGPYDSKVDIVSAYTMTMTAMGRENRGIYPLKCAPEDYAQHATDFVAWLQWLRSSEGVQGGHYPPGLYSEDKPCLTENTDEEVKQFALRYQAMFRSAALGRSLVRTKKGFLGLARHTVQAGDMVCIAIGGALPLLLRARDQGGYSYVGDVYIHGIMHGEALPGGESSDGDAEDFEVY
ncbi:hypothetical protein HJFPF1_02420 [Paramyrothecium foliicola]|nr:hypothetical protein HJFPF1_02420 [Paramyrothecium foliicola]